MANSNTLENLRPIPGLDGYFVSACGDVYSNRVKGLRKLKPGKTKNGYLTFGARISGKTKSFYVHRCVALSFVAGYADDLDVCHQNTIKTDNRAANLRWDDRSGNMADSAHLVRGEKNHASKLTSEQVEEIRRAYANRNSHFWGATEMAKRFGVSQTRVSAIARGETWENVK